jgi:hypothetical protein
MAAGVVAAQVRLAHLYQAVAAVVMEATALRHQFLGHP